MSGKNQRKRRRKKAACIDGQEKSDQQQEQQQKQEVFSEMFPPLLPSTSPPQQQLPLYAPLPFSMSVRPALPNISPSSVSASSINPEQSLVASNGEQAQQSPLTSGELSASLPQIPSSLAQSLSILLSPSESTASSSNASLINILLYTIQVSNQCSQALMQQNEQVIAQNRGLVTLSGQLQTELDVIKMQLRTQGNFFLQVTAPLASRVQALETRLLQIEKDQFLQRLQAIQEQHNSKFQEMKRDFDAEIEKLRSEIRQMHQMRDQQTFLVSPQTTRSSRLSFFGSQAVPAPAIQQTFEVRRSNLTADLDLSPSTGDPIPSSTNARRSSPDSDLFLSSSPLRMFEPNPPAFSLSQGFNTSPTQSFPPPPSSELSDSLSSRTST